jgi:hypothetical protein
MIAKPTVGQRVRVHTDYSKYKLGFVRGIQRKFVTEGIVSESASWEPANSFALLTTDRKLPLKTIDLQWVTRIEPTDSTDTIQFESVAKQANSFETFQVAGSKGNAYVVTRDKFSYTCTCVAGSFGRHCKHIAGVISSRPK